MNEAIISLDRRGAHHLGSRGYPIISIGDVTVFDLNHNQLYPKIHSLKDQNHDGWHSISVDDENGVTAYTFVLNMDLNLGWLRPKQPNVGGGYIKIKFEQ
ncbi:hypothetical protein FDJ06_gp116 [Pseudomonas phage SL2]|uniref:Uncharacterized protein n=1 Tax=Pseudomonas phage SL2 TaxID=2041345 RepID=A0A2D1GQT6_9CAUD|nr:hypothetical protein FDJ06_gp116 [Pseudomonas phage SL2]ATN94693.1 hypothetical protein SL2_116 [Pseudomonas phage SL2]